MPHKNKSVLIIDDNEDDYRIISRDISDSYITEYLDGIKNTLDQIAHLNPDCILLDYHMSTKEGIECLKTIKSTEELKRVPVIMMTGEESPDIIIACMKNNADDYLIKGKYDRIRILHAIEQAISNADLKKKIDKQQKLILQMSRTDELTGVFSRRYLMERIDDEILRSKRRKGFFSLAMIDLDSFKQINDIYGHLTGDLILKEMTKIIKNGIRSTDYVGRFGGDEFVIVLLDLEKNKKENTIQNHGRILDTIRKNISSSVIIPSKEDTHIMEPIKFSVSCGYTVFDDSISTASDLLINADRALFKAKENGKNCVAFYEGDKITFLDTEIVE